MENDTVCIVDLTPVGVPIGDPVAVSEWVVVPIDAAVPGPCTEVCKSVLSGGLSEVGLLDALDGLVMLVVVGSCLLVAEKWVCVKVVKSTYIVGNSPVMVKDPCYGVNSRWCG